VGGEEFAGLLAGLFFDREGRGIAEAGMKQVVATLKAVGRKGECHAVFCRVARLQDSIEIDLGDDSWQAVLISPDGWEVGQTSARFIRTRNTGALPVPERGGHVELLRPLVNVRDEDWPLFVGSILDAYKGHGPYFVSVFSGEQGSGKSTLVRMLTRLIDPVKSAELLTLPRDERDGAVVPSRATSSATTTSANSTSGSPISSAGSRPAAACGPGRSTPTTAWPSSTAPGPSPSTASRTSWSPGTWPAGA